MCRSRIVARDAIEAVTDRSAIITAGFEELTPYQRCILAPGRRASSDTAMEQNVSLSLSETPEKWSEYAQQPTNRRMGDTVDPRSSRATTGNGGCFAGTHRRRQVSNGVHNAAKPEMTMRQKNGPSAGDMKRRGSLKFGLPGRNNTRLAKSQKLQSFWTHALINFAHVPEITLPPQGGFFSLCNP